MKRFFQFLTTVFTLLVPLSLATSVFASYNTSDNIPTNYINIGTPQDALVLSDGDIWYVDSQNYRVVKVNQSGEILRTVGRQGNEWGEFNTPLSGITQDDDGNLYVLGENKVFVLDSNGGMVDKWGTAGSGASEFGTGKGITYDTTTDTILVSDMSNNKVMSFDKDGDFNFKFGSLGSSNGKFNNPYSLKTDSNGKIYVVDSDNHRVQVFSKTGGFLFKFGSVGTADGHFTFPKDVEILTNGRIVVTSQNSQKIQTFSTTGTFISSFGVHGDGDSQLEAPQYITRDSSNNLFVTDWMHNSIQKFSSSGVYSLSIRNSGITNGRLTAPDAAAYDSSGNLYVLDNGSGNARIQKFTNSGTYLSTILTADSLGTAVYHMVIKDNYIYVTHGSGFKKYDTGGGLALQQGGPGSDDGFFNDARGIDVDSSGNIYVADFWNNRIQKFDSNGLFISQFGGDGTDPGDTTHPQSLYIDEDDNIFVASNFNSEFTRVQAFNTSGVYQFTVGSSGTGEGQYSQNLAGIVKDASGNIYITDTINHRIAMYDSSYDFVQYIGKLGGGSGEFNEPAGLAYNPENDSLVIADRLNHRVQYLAEGVRIFNLIPSADVLRTSDDSSLVTNYYDPSEPDIDDVSAQMYFGDLLVADFDVDLTEDRNWEDVNIISAPTEAKTLVNNLDPGSAPGVSMDTNLYVTRQSEQTELLICPDATTLDEINVNCDGATSLELDDPDVEPVTVDSVDYWRILGVSNVGVMAILPADHFDIEISDTNVETGDTVEVIVTVKDANGNTVENYTGTIEVSGDGIDDTTYEFQPEDLGTHTFEFVLDNPRDYEIDVVDTEDESISGSSEVITATDPSSDTDEESEDEPTTTPPYALSGVDTEDDDDVKEIIDDIVDGDPLTPPTNTPTGNENKTPNDSKDTKSGNFTFLYWLVPFILLIFFVFYGSLNRDNKV